MMQKVLITIALYNKVSSLHKKRNIPSTSAKWEVVNISSKCCDYPIFMRFVKHCRMRTSAQTFKTEPIVLFMNV